METTTQEPKYQTVGRPFTARYMGSRCAVCKERVKKGELLSKLDRVHQWTVERVNKYNKAQLRLRSSAVAHDSCIPRS